MKDVHHSASAVFGLAVGNYQVCSHCRYCHHTGYDDDRYGRAVIVNVNILFGTLLISFSQN